MHSMLCICFYFTVIFILLRYKNVYRYFCSLCYIQNSLNSTCHKGHSCIAATVNINIISCFECFDRKVSLSMAALFQSVCNNTIFNSITQNSLWSSCSAKINRFKEHRYLTMFNIRFFICKRYNGKCFIIKQSTDIVQNFIFVVIVLSFFPVFSERHILFELYQFSCYCPVFRIILVV